MTLLVEEDSECQVASILKISKTAVHKNKFKLHNKATDLAESANYSNVTQQPQDDIKWPTSGVHGEDSSKQALGGRVKKNSPLSMRSKEEPG